MLVLRRIALPFINAAFITAGLFVLMYSLVHTDDPDLLAPAETPALRFAAAQEDSPVEVIAPKPKPPVLVDEAPDIPFIADIIVDDLITPTGLINPTIETGFIDTGTVGDGQLTILMGFPPVYPSSQAHRGTEGYVVVGFSVNAVGEVYDAHVIESQPKGAFDRSALKAISKFRYRARIVNGKAVSTDGQRYMFKYEMES